MLALIRLSHLRLPRQKQIFVWLAIERVIGSALEFLSVIGLESARLSGGWIDRRHALLRQTRQVADSFTHAEVYLSGSQSLFFWSRVLYNLAHATVSCSKILNSIHPNSVKAPRVWRVFLDGNILSNPVLENSVIGTDWRSSLSPDMFTSSIRPHHSP